MKPYLYSQLNEQEKANYRQMYEGIRNFQREIKIDNPVGWDRFWELEELLMLDYPDFAILDRFGRKASSLGNQLIYKPSYFGDVTKYFEMQKAFYEQCNLIVSKVIKPGMTDFDKEVALHDFILKNIEYGYVANEELGKDLSQSAFCTLQYRKGVCRGIASLFKCLTNLAGLDCLLIRGYHGDEEEGPDGKNHRHAWNIIKIDGGYAHVDVTHDLDSEFGHFDHTKINFTDEEAGRDKYHWKENTWPSCQRPDLNYYVQRNLYVVNEEQLEQFIKDRVKNKIYTYTFKYMGELEKKSYDEMRELISKYTRKHGFNKLYYTNHSEAFNTINVGIK